MASLQPEIEEMVTCAICTSRLMKPKHLTCQHTFCSLCLQGWMDSPTNVHDKKQLPCPTCRFVTKLGEDGVQGLPSDFDKNALLELLDNPVKADRSGEEDSELPPCCVCKLTNVHEMAVSYCDDCSQYMCGVCLGDHNTEPALAGHQVHYDLVDGVLSEIFCSRHSSKKLNFYCPQCSVLLCSVCVQTSHRGHNAEPLNTAHEKRVASIKGLMKQLDMQLENLVASKSHVNEKFFVEAMFEALKSDIKRHTENQRLAIDKWEQTALRDLDRRQEVLRRKVCRKEEYVAKLTSLKSYYEQQLQILRPRELLDGFSALVRRADPYLESASSDLIPIWTFVPLTWPTRLGYLKLVNSEQQHAASGSNDIDYSEESELSGLVATTTISEDPLGFISATESFEPQQVVSELVVSELVGNTNEQQPGQPSQLYAHI